MGQPSIFWANNNDDHGAYLMGEAIQAEFGERQRRLVSSDQCISGSVRSNVADYLAGVDPDADHHCPEGLYALVLKAMEKPLLEESMRWADGNQTRCAELLGLSRGTLRKKLKSCDLV